MFATIIVVLPTLHTGGAAHLSHSGVSVTLDSSQGSLTNTTMLAWYTDVLHEVRPVMSGYRLALSFNLIHTGVSLRPSLPDDDTGITRLQHVLTSWESSVKGPEKLIYLLGHQYSRSDLRRGALKGADAHKVGLLETLATQCNFDLGLANLECHLSGYAEEDYGYGGCWSTRRGRSSTCMGEVEEREMTITGLVGLDGTSLQEDVDYEEDELIPQNLAEVVEEDDPDDEEYEGYQGNVSQSAQLQNMHMINETLVRWVSRAVLVHTIDITDCHLLTWM
jgi:hypothetical protein